MLWGKGQADCPDTFLTFSFVARRELRIKGDACDLSIDVHDCVTEQAKGELIEWNLRRVSE